MNVNVAEPAQIVLRNLSDDHRRRVWAWIDNLKRWGTDSLVRQHAKKLDGDGNVYMLLAGPDNRIFFELGENSITVLDVAKKATIIKSGQNSGPERRFRRALCKRSLRRLKTGC
jgi:hypothetical protein